MHIAFRNKVLEFRYPNRTIFTNRHLSEQVCLLEKNPDNHFDLSPTNGYYDTLSTCSLLKKFTILKACTFEHVVNNQMMIIKVARRNLGDRFVSSIIRNTIYSHFVAGENDLQLLDTIKELEKQSIGAIIDYAVENDVCEESSENYKSPNHKTCTDDLSKMTNKQLLNSLISSNVSNYTGAAYFSNGTDNFANIMDNLLKSINIAKQSKYSGYVAIKVSSLCPPNILDSISKFLNLMNKHSIDSNEDQYVEKMFKHLNLILKDNNEIATIKNLLTENKMSLNDLFNPIYDLWKLNHLIDSNQKSLNFPEKHVISEYQQAYNRLAYLCSKAKSEGVHLMIDAEQSYLQPAIRNLAIKLMKSFNTKDSITVYNTYQCYLKETNDVLAKDMLQFNNDNPIGVKLVRGAYMEVESKLSKLNNYPSLIHEDIGSTHEAYDEMVVKCIENAASNKCAVIFATHNQNSLQKAMHLMVDQKLENNHPFILFGQLYGMYDAMTWKLAQNSYRTYKYVPYGPVMDVLPYLIRRSYENRSVVQSAAHQLDVMQNLLIKRLLFQQKNKSQ